MMSPPKVSLPGFPNCLDTKAAAWLTQAIARVTARGKALAEVFPALPRRLGRQLLGRQQLGSVGDGVIDLAAWRYCDAGAVMLIEAAAATDEQILDLYYHGDFEEKTMVFRSRALAPVTDATITLIGEAQRTNTGDHFEAAICDSNLLVRAVESDALPLADFNRTILKVAFVGLPFARLLDASTHASEELSRMLQDLASEREAAGRRVWPDTFRLIAAAPTPGSLARLAGGLEHGDDAYRRAAAEGLAHVAHTTQAAPTTTHLALLAMAKERLEREPVAAIRTALQVAIDGPDPGKQHR